MGDIEEASKLRSKYTHFRVLVIGRANAGKTTLLKRVCNTLDEPCIFDEENNNLLEPTSERGIHNIHHPFAFASNPQFIFHDSPGFEAGGEEELHEVQSFITQRARSTEVKDQLHAIWFCLVTDNARPLLELETRFFNEQRAGNAPVIAIFTKFDDFVTQIYDMDKEEEDNHEIAMGLLEDKFRKPLSKYKFPPRSDVYFEAIHDNNGDHQEQVKKLIDQTADALDSLALKMLFVSVQHNNLELCIKYAIKYSPLLRRNIGSELSMITFVNMSLEWFKHSYYDSYDYGKTEKDDFGQEFFEAFGERRRGSTSKPVQQEGEAAVGFFGFFERRGEGLEGRRRSANANSVTALINQTFPNPSLAALAVILICLHNSYGPTSHSTAFVNAFQQAFQLLIQSSTKNNVDSAILRLGVYPSTFIQQEAFKYALLQIIVDHCDSYDNHSQFPH